MKELPDLTPEAAKLLWEMCFFCEEWEGKVIEYTVTPLRDDYPPRAKKGLVLGHDGPEWNDEIGWVRSWAARGALGTGWGCIVILQSVGTENYISPELIDSVKEIRRDAPAATEYEAEAVDLFCPYGCDAKGLTDWDENWSGPEFEVFCPVHNRAAYERGRDLYHRDEGFDGSRPDLEREYYELTKVAYEKAGVKE